MVSLETLPLCNGKRGKVDSRCFTGMVMQEYESEHTFGSTHFVKKVT